MCIRGRKVKSVLSLASFDHLVRIGIRPNGSSRIFSQANKKYAMSDGRVLFLHHVHHKQCVDESGGE